MKKSTSKSNLFSFILFLLIANSSESQIWSPMDQGVDSTVYSLFTWNNTVYAGGMFSSSVAEFNGTSWNALGTGTDGHVRALEYYDGQLVAGGLFTTITGLPANNIATWDGTFWDTLAAGLDGIIHCLHTDTVNNLLYAGGDFNNSGTTSTSKVAVWDGTSWSSLGTGMDFWVNTLMIYNNELYAGGDFDVAGGTAAGHFAKWDGSTWSTVGGGASLEVNTMKVFNGNLYVGGAFTGIGGVAGRRIARYDGTTWSTVGIGFSDQVMALEVFQNSLYAGGEFIANYNFTDTLGTVSRWADSVWVPASNVFLDSSVFALASSSSTFYSGGIFTDAGATQLNYVAQTDVTLGLSEIYLEDLQVFPNPTSGAINLYSTDILNEVKLHDLSGRMVFSTIVKESFYKLDLSNQKNGFYILIVNNKTYKIIKN
jgi:trimeric autotransporter adhesin